MNTRIKGRKAENELATLLRKQGYLIEQVKGSSKFNKSVDFFGWFDMLAVSKKNTLLVQVKSNSTNGAKKAITNWLVDGENIKQFHPIFKFRIAVRKDGLSEDKRWVIHEFNRKLNKFIKV